MPIGLSTLSSLATAGLGAGQMVAGKIKEKKAEGMGPALVDPNQRAMANLTRRQFRATQTGTAYATDYKQGAALAKMMMNKSLLGGGRSMAPIMDLMKTNQANITQRAGQERTGLLATLVQQEQDIADRKMDLQGLAQQKLEDKSQALLSSGRQNLMGGAGTILSGSKSGTLKGLLKGG